MSSAKRPVRRRSLTSPNTATAKAKAAKKSTKSIGKPKTAKKRPRTIGKARTAKKPPTIVGKAKTKRKTRREGEQHLPNVRSQPATTNLAPSIQESLGTCATCGSPLKARIIAVMAELDDDATEGQMADHLAALESGDPGEWGMKVPQVYCPQCESPLKQAMARRT